MPAFAELRSRDQVLTLLDHAQNEELYDKGAMVRLVHSWEQQAAGLDLSGWQREILRAAQCRLRAVEYRRDGKISHAQISETESERCIGPGPADVAGILEGALNTGESAFWSALRDNYPEFDEQIGDLPFHIVAEFRGAMRTLIRHLAMRGR